MKVTVKLFVTHQRGGVQQQVHEYPEGVTARSVVEDLAWSGSGHFLVLINGRVADLDRKLAEGDVLALLPPVAGG